MRISQIKYPAMSDEAPSGESRTMIVVLEFNDREVALIRAYFESQNKGVASFASDLRSVLGFVGTNHILATPHIFEVMFTPELRTAKGIRNAEAAERRVLAAAAHCLKHYEESL